MKIFYLALTYTYTTLRPMEYLLSFIYILSFFFLVRYLDKKSIIHLDFRLAAAAFLLKVFLACAYGYIFQQYYGGDDTWMYHHQSLEETQFLKNDPLHFLHSLIDPTSYTRYMMTTWWQELEYASLIKLLAILNLFSDGHYYVTAVLFSMISFWGAYFYYRTLTTIFPNSRTVFALVFFFFIPLVFWTSGIRKDGLIMLFSGMFFLNFYRFHEFGKIRFLVLALVALIGVSLNRNFVALSLIPVAIAWSIAIYGKMRPIKSYVLVYSTALVIFFLSAVTGPVNLPSIVVNRQADFLALKGRSYIELQKLDDNPLTFLKLLPEAVNHVLLRPYPGEQSGALYIFSTIETWFVNLFFFLFLLFPLPGSLSRLLQASVLGLLCFALTNYLFIGYTIPFLGAIVRYRIIFESILLALIAAQINWSKFPWLHKYTKFL